MVDHTINDAALDDMRAPGLPQEPLEVIEHSEERIFDDEKGWTEYLAKLKITNEQHIRIATDRKFTPACDNFASGSAGFKPTSRDWESRRLSDDLGSLDELMEKGACIFYTHTSPDDKTTSGLNARKHRKVGREFHSLLRQNFLHTLSVLVRQDALADAGLLGPKLVNAQDWDLWIWLSEVGKFGHIDEILTHYRLHEGLSVKMLKFARNVVCADQLVMARWSEAEVLPYIQAKIGYDYWVLARKEWKHGNFKEARAAYWRSAKYGHKQLHSIARTIYCSIPSPILRVLKR